MKKVIALLLMLSLGACSTLNFPRGVDKTDLKGKEVGVIAILGDNLDSINIGGTVFNNGAYSISVPEWHIDEFANQAAYDDLSKSTTFHTVKIDRDVGSVEPYYKGPRSNKISLPKLTTIAKQNGVAVLVVIRRTSSERTPMGGYGLLKQSPLGISMGNPLVYTHVVIQVVNVNTGEDMAWKDSEIGYATRLTQTSQISESYSPSEQAEIMAGVKAGLKRQVHRLLANMNLIN